VPSFAIAISLMVLSSAVAESVAMAPDGGRSGRLCFGDGVILKDKSVTKLRHVA
jgi:hypothetical protein